MSRLQPRDLHRIFRTLVLALAPAAGLGSVAGACGSDVNTPRDAGPDASRDGGQPSDAQLDVVAESAADAAADSASCKTYFTTRDAALADTGVDADDLGCDYTLTCGLPEPIAFIGCDIYQTNADGTPADGGAIGCRLPASTGCATTPYKPTRAPITIECFECSGSGGRKPHGLVKPKTAKASTELGAYFAGLAHDETASVAAFERMHVELSVHHAPMSLLAAATRSLHDERRHARMMARLALRHGAPVPTPRIRKRGAPRKLRAIARENAVEGCVRETFGALLAHFQAEHAEQPALRQTFKRIAADETRHAELAWNVARWAETLMNARDRAFVAAAQRRALHTLRSELTTLKPISNVGRPTPVQALALLDGLQSALGHLL